MQHEVDEMRMGPVLDRITMGLYYHHFSKRLPDSHMVIGVMEYRMDLPHAEDLAKMAQNGPLHDIGGGVFQYHYIRPDAQKDENMSVWFMRFYEDVPFLSMTVPISKDSRGRPWPPKVLTNR
jgi:hypothetical protein